MTRASQNGPRLSAVKDNRPPVIINDATKSSARFTLPLGSLDDAETCLRSVLHNTKNMAPGDIHGNLDYHKALKLLL